MATKEDAQGRRFFEVPGGELGPGRLFQNPNLTTLDKLLEAQESNPTTQGRRDAGTAFKNFSAFLDLQDRRKVARQNADLKREAVKQQIEKQRIENEAARKQTPVSDLTPELIGLASLPRAEFLQGMTRLRQSGKRLKSADLINLNNANLAQVQSNRLQASEDRQVAAAEARTPEAKLKQGIALVEKELGRSMTRGERIRFSDSKTRGDLLQELSEEIEAGPEEEGETTQDVEQSGELRDPTRKEAEAIVAEVGSTDPDELAAAFANAGFRTPGRRK
jgi:hypothetical protein